MELVALFASFFPMDTLHNHLVFVYCLMHAVTLSPSKLLLYNHINNQTDQHILVHLQEISFVKQIYCWDNLSLQIKNCAHTLYVIGALIFVPIWFTSPWLMNMYNLFFSVNTDIHNTYSSLI